MTATIIATGANLGNLTYGGGVGAAYVGSVQKPSFLAALLTPSLRGTNWLAKNWSAVPGLMPTTLPPVMAGQAVALRYSVAKFTATAPIDQSFVGLAPTTATFAGWDGLAWQVLWSGATAGTAGETIEVMTTALADTDFYYAHAFGVSGDGLMPAAIASLRIYAGAAGLLSPLVAAPTTPPIVGHVATALGHYGYGGAAITFQLVHGVLAETGSYSYVPQ